MSRLNLIPVYYAYMIGYFGHMNDLPDQNVHPNGANLSTGGAALIKANRKKIIDMYAHYAMTDAAPPGRRSRWSGSWRATSSSTPRHPSPAR